MKRRYVVELDETFWLGGRPHDVEEVVEASSPDAAIRRVMRERGLSFVADAWVHVEGAKRQRFVYRGFVRLVLPMREGMSDEPS